jgi:hypothetical protein
LRELNKGVRSLPLLRQPKASYLNAKADDLYVKVPKQPPDYDPGRPVIPAHSIAQKKQTRKFGLKEFDLESVFAPLSPIHHITQEAL